MNAIVPETLVTGALTPKAIVAALVEGHRRDHDRR